MISFFSMNDIFGFRNWHSAHVIIWIYVDFNHHRLSFNLPDSFQSHFHMVKFKSDTVYILLLSFFPIKIICIFYFKYCEAFIDNLDDCDVPRSVRKNLKCYKRGKEQKSIIELQQLMKQMTRTRKLKLYKLM